jgi:hypothetical protein
MAATLSPTPVKAEEGKVIPPKPQKPMSFSQAVAHLIEGKKIYKEEWKNKEFYGILADGRLKLHKPDGKLYDWVISDGDLSGKDWIVL